MRVETHCSQEKLERWIRSVKQAKLRIICWAGRGETAEEIVERVGLSRRRVQDWVARYNEHELDGLQDRSVRGRKLPLPQSQIELLKQRLDEGAIDSDGICVFTGTLIQPLIECEFCTLLLLSATYYLLHANGCSWLVPRPRHPQADPQKQAAFKKELPVKLAELQRLHPTKRLQVFFQDEARFGQQGTLTRLWARHGQRVTTLRQTQYDYLYVIGAVCPTVGQA